MMPIPVGNHLPSSIKNVHVIAPVVATPVEIIDLIVVGNESTIPQTVDISNDIINIFAEATICKCCFHCQQLIILFNK